MTEKKDAMKDDKGTEDDEKGVWARLLAARQEMSLRASGTMRLGGQPIRYATKGDMLTAILAPLARQGLWARTQWHQQDGDGPERLELSVVDTRSGEAVRLGSLPVRLTGQDAKKDSAALTSYTRYLLATGLGLAEGDGDAYAARPAPQARPARRPLTPLQQRLLARLGEMGAKGRDQVNAILRPITGHAVEHFADITDGEAQAALDRLEGRETRQSQDSTQEQGQEQEK